MHTLHTVMMGFSRVCFEMEGLGGFVSLEGTGKAESFALSAQFSKQKSGVCDTGYQSSVILACGNIPQDLV